MPNDLLFAGQASVFSNGFDAVGSQLEAATRYINAKGFNGIRGRPAMLLSASDTAVPVFSASRHSHSDSAKHTWPE